MTGVYENDFFIDFTTQNYLKDFMIKWAFMCHVFIIFPTNGKVAKGEN